MSEGFKALSMDDLEKVTGGVAVYQMVDSKCQLVDQYGQKLGMFSSMEEAKEMALRHGLSLYSAKEAARAGIMRTKSPMI